MLEIPTFSSITNELKQNLQKELINYKEESFGNIYYVNRSRIRDIAILLHDRNVVFIDIAINDLDTKFELIYEYYIKILKDKRKYIFVITEVDKNANEIDSIEVVYPQALKIEKEIEKRYGLKFILFTEEVGKELFVIPTSLVSPDFELNLLPIGVF